MALLEAGGFLFPGIITRIAAEAWILAGAVYLVLATFVVGKTLVRDIRALYPLLGWFVLLLAAFLTFWGAGGIERVEINAESSLQVAAGLANFDEPDLALNEKGFLSYPRRQYSIAALPAWLTGRNLWALRLGFALPFFTGLLVFYAGLRAASRRPGAFAAALGVTLVFCFAPVVTWLRTYEQTILPLAFTLHATGWWLLGRAHKLPVPAVALGLAWLGGVLAMGYTPGLASAALLVVLVAGGTIFHVWRSAIPANRFLGSQVILYVMILCCIALWLQWGPQLGFGSSGRRPPNNEPGQRALDFLKGVFLSQPNGGLVFPILVIPFMAFVGAALAGFLGARARVIAAWSALTLVAAVFLRGYVQRPAAFDLHRAMVIIPPLSALAALWVDRLRYFHPSPGLGWRGPARQTALVVVILLVVGHGTWTHGESLHLSPPGPRPIDAALLDTIEFTRARGLPPVAAVEFRGAAEVAPLNVPDFLSYFLPGARFRRGQAPQARRHWHPVVVLFYRAANSDEDNSPTEFNPVENRRVMMTRGKIPIARIAEFAPPD